MKLSDDFSLIEFAPKSIKYRSSWKPESDYQFELIKIMVSNLQVIRDHVNSEINISSAVRLPSDFERLQKAGYNPSPTSDHFFGSVITSNRRTNKSSFFDGLWFMSVGAVDITCPTLSPEELIKAIKFLHAKGLISLGQVILESGNKSRWVHLSNSFINVHKMLCDKKILRVTEPQYLQSTNNGVSYSTLNI